MLLNVSYNNKVITRKINKEVGEPFSLKKRWAMRGIGSPKLFITQTSTEIQNLLVLDNNTNSCNIELRPQGIIVRFRSLLETYAMVIPYYKLTIYKGDSAIYSIYRDHYFIKVKAEKKAIHNFFKKILDAKIENTPKSIEEL